MLFRSMTSSTFEAARVPAARRAIGYRLKPDGTYAEEPPLPHGAFGSMGGLLTTANDLSKYVAFHLSAWPPRDEPDAGPVRRSSIREMSQPWTPNTLVAAQGAGRVRAMQTGYGFGLGVQTDCRFGQAVGHGGGLPGFGSYMQWLPEYGVGFFAMANLTYAGPARPIGQAFEALQATGGLQRREAPPSPALAAIQPRIWELWQQWDDAKAKQIAAMNLFLDAPIPQRRAQIEGFALVMGAHERPQHLVAGAEGNAEIINETIVRLAGAGVVEQRLAPHFLGVVAPLRDDLGHDCADGRHGSLDRLTPRGGRDRGDGFDRGNEILVPGASREQRRRRGVGSRHTGIGHTGGSARSAGQAHCRPDRLRDHEGDRKSTRLNPSHT